MNHSVKAMHITVQSFNPAQLRERVLFFLTEIKFLNFVTRIVTVTHTSKKGLLIYFFLK